MKGVSGQPVRKKRKDKSAALVSFIRVVHKRIETYK